MSDRTSKLREALEWFDSSQTIHRSDQHPVSVMAEAARKWLDLFDSDALIIRRDENGDWPEWTRRAIADLGPWAGNADQILDALASSQGVEL